MSAEDLVYWFRWQQIQVYKYIRFYVYFFLTLHLNKDCVLLPITSPGI